MEPNTVHCPKCQSTQLYFDKKGFSGKKAVVGAVLTGGLGLLAGTIGSNKILASCLSCGNKFSPENPKAFASNPTIKNNTPINVKPMSKTLCKVIMTLFSLLTLILAFVFTITLMDSGFSFFMFLLLLAIIFLGSMVVGFNKLLRTTAI